MIEIKCPSLESCESDYITKQEKLHVKLFAQMQMQIFFYIENEEPVLCSISGIRRNQINEIPVGSR